MFRTLKKELKNVDVLIADSAYDSRLKKSSNGAKRSLVESLASLFNLFHTL